MERPFYGWVIVTASFFVFATAYGMQFSYGLYLPYFESEFRLNKANAAAPFSFYIVIYSLLSPISGRMTDEYGTRRIVAFGGLLLAIGYMLLSQAKSMWQVYLVFGIISGIGMSATFIPVNATVVKWFVQKRGTAFAVAGAGSNLGLVLFPFFATSLIAYSGWRSSMLVTGFITAVVILMCSRFLLSDPESLGLSPDGTRSVKAKGMKAENLVAHLTKKEAVGTKSFWLILLVFLFTWSILFFPYAHLPSLAEDLGFSRAFGGGLIAAMGVGSLAGRVIIGIMSDKLGRRGSLLFSLFAQALACLLLIFASTSSVLTLSAALFGLGAGATATLFPGMVGDYFGRKHVGEISGLIFGVTSTVSALSPYVAGLLRDISGSYFSSFVIGVAFNLVAIVFLCLLRSPVLVGRR